MKILFLDLDETLIIDWDNIVPIRENLDRIHNFIVQEQISEAYIFSASIWTEEERLFFQNNIEPVISPYLGDIHLIPLLFKDIFSTIVKEHKLHVEPSDFNDLFVFNTKMQPFIEWCKIKKKGSTCVLFDDIVDNSVVQFPDLDLTIEFKKIEVTK